MSHFVFNLKKIKLNYKTKVQVQWWKNVPNFNSYIFFLSRCRRSQYNMPSFEKVWPMHPPPPPKGGKGEARPDVLFAKQSVSKQSKSFSFIGSRRGLATNDTLFCRHPAGDKDRGLKINCKTKNKQSKKHDAGQGIGWGARRGGMDATARGGARISVPPRFSGLWFRPGKREATARLRLVSVFFSSIFFLRRDGYAILLGKRDCANDACREERARNTSLTQTHTRYIQFSPSKKKNNRVYDINRLLMCS